MTDSPEMTREDRELMDALRDAYGFDERPSAEALQMIMTGYDIANIDVLITDLVHDSALHDEPVPVRGGDAGARMVSFEGEGVRFDFEVGDAAPHIVGRLTPFQAGTVALDQVGNQQGEPLDESGTFEFSISMGTPYRLRFTPEGGQSIATEWLISSPEA